MENATPRIDLFSVVVSLLLRQSHHAKERSYPVSQPPSYCAFLFWIIQQNLSTPFWKVHMTVKQASGKFWGLTVTSGKNSKRNLQALKLKLEFFELFNRLLQTGYLQTYGIFGGFGFQPTAPYTT